MQHHQRDGASEETVNKRSFRDSCDCRRFSFVSELAKSDKAREAVEQCGLKDVTSLPLIAQEAATVAKNRLANLLVAAGGPRRLDREVVQFNAGRRGSHLLPQQLLHRLEGAARRGAP